MAAAQLAAGFGGMALALRRRRAFDILFWRGPSATVGRDCVLMGTALSAPLVMLGAQAWAIAVLLRRPDAAAERTLGGLGRRDDSWIPGRAADAAAACTRGLAESRNTCCRRRDKPVRDHGIDRPSSLRSGTERLNHRSHTSHQRTAHHPRQISMPLTLSKATCDCFNVKALCRSENLTPQCYGVVLRQGVTFKAFWLPARCPLGVNPLLRNASAGIR